MKIKFGDVKVELPNEKLFERFFAVQDPFKSTFAKYNPELLNDFQKELTPMMTNAFEEYKQLMEKYYKKIF